MSLLFGQIFACCLRSSPTPKPDEPSSSTQTPNDVASPPESNRQKVKERLGNIVRSKEGKMVNVADHLPFNLNHRNISGVSTSRLRTESPSPHPSVRTGETSTSRSESSHRPLVGRLGLPKESALNIRLVKGRNRRRRGSSGRARLGRFGDASEGEARGIEWAEYPSTREREESSHQKYVPEMHISDLDAVPPEIEPLEDADRTYILTLSGKIGEQLRNGWNIGDPGPISRGWGD